jgi:hypothetical protein
MLKGAAEQLMELETTLPEILRRLDSDEEKRIVLGAKVAAMLAARVRPEKIRLLEAEIAADLEKSGRDLHAYNVQRSRLLSLAEQESLGLRREFYDSCDEEISAIQRGRKSRKIDKSSNFLTGKKMVLLETNARAVAAAIDRVVADRAAVFGMATRPLSEIRNAIAVHDKWYDGLDLHQTETVEQGYESWAADRAEGRLSTVSADTAKLNELKQRVDTLERSR